MADDAITAADWIKGIGFSVLASIIGASSKLSIRKSWLIEHKLQEEEDQSPLLTHGSQNSANSAFLLMDTPESPPRSTVRTRRGNNPSRVDGSSMTQDAADNEMALDDVDSNEDNLSCDGGSGGMRLVESSSPPGRLLVPLQLDDQAVAAASGRKLRTAHCLRFMGFLGMTIFNPACSVIAMNYASPSILAPLAGLTLVWVIVFSKPFVEETPSFQQVVACSFILVGEVVVAVFGDHTNDEGLTIEDVKQSYHDTLFLLYFVGLFAWILLLARWMALPSNRASSTLKRFSWGVAGGSLTGMQNFLKDALTVFKASPAENKLPPPLFFVFLICAATSAFVGLLILTLAMKRYDATYSAAMFVGSFVVSASIMSEMHYHTFSHLTSTVDIVFYPAGLAMLIMGVILLAGQVDDSIDRESIGSSLEDYPTLPPTAILDTGERRPPSPLDEPRELTAESDHGR